MCVYAWRTRLLSRGDEGRLHECSIRMGKAHLVLQWCVEKSAKGSGVASLDKMYWFRIIFIDPRCLSRVKGFVAPRALFFCTPNQLDEMEKHMKQP